jgi:hypothetical protein
LSLLPLLPLQLAEDQLAVTVCRWHVISACSCPLLLFALPLLLQQLAEAHLLALKSLCLICTPEETRVVDYVFGTFPITLPLAAVPAAIVATAAC